MDTTEIQVFVSCPKDVNEEKQIAKEVCARTNINLVQSGCNIRVMFRDYSEIIGQIGKRPQEVINETIVGYNIYLGILFMRFGTPTGAISLATNVEFQSGTEEEFELANEKRKLGGQPEQIFFFFKNPVGPQPGDEYEQLGKVLSFKQKLSGGDWVNSFKDKYEFKDLLTDLLWRLTLKLCNSRRIDTKSQLLIQSGQSHTDGAVINFENFVPPLPNITHYIARSIKLFNEQNDELSFLFEGNKKRLFLQDALNQEKRIVLLGNAGTGKSIELQNLAKYFLNSNTPFIPIYKRFNTYVDEEIGNFLPEGWEKINQELLMILLDGLDEIQPQYFNNAVRRLIDFGEKNLKVRIVISCRTNFYELPGKTFSGTLTGYKVYILNDISNSEIKNYLSKEIEVDSEKFIRQAYDNSFSDLIQKPFFLNILLQHYKDTGSLKATRSSIIENFIISRIESDQEHFKASFDIHVTQQTVLSLLEKVAFIMELTGKNFITTEDLISVTNEQELNQIKHFSAFTKNPKDDTWMFEHNNIQEFLASRLLTKLSFEKLTQTISFPPSHLKVKPTWVNTISFFISIAEERIRTELINWLIEKEREIIVKFEPDRISQDLRIQLFKQIFNFYKQKNIWLNSNKFSGNELSRFAASDDIIQFLLDEISNKSNTNIVRLNAIHVLDYYDLNEFEPRFKEKAKEILLSILDDEDPDANMIYSILSGLGKMSITDNDTIKHVVGKYKRRKNQYVRAGLYSLINKSNLLDQYIDLYIDGLQLNNIEEGINDRDSVNLADESWHLERGFKQVKSPKTLKRILVFLHPKRKDLLYQHKEIFDDILNTTFNAYKLDPSLYENIYDIYVNERWYYQNNIIPKIIEFLEKENMKWQFFKKIWDDESINVNEKDLLLEPLIDKNIFNSFLTEFEKRNFTKDDALKIHGLIFWHNINERIGDDEISQFENKIRDISNLILERPKRIDWTSINKIKNQRSFDLLFDKNAMLLEIQNVFKEIQKDELQNEDLWELRKNNYQLLDEAFARSALDVLRDFTAYGRNVNYTQVDKWIQENINYNIYQIREIYQDLKRFKNEISVSIDQKNFIQDWCYDMSGKIDLKTAVHYNSGDKTTVSTNWNAQYLWFFINYFNLKIDDAKLIDYTLFYDFENHQKESETAVIEKLETFITKSLIEERVSRNLSEGIDVSYVWKSNALYAIENNLKNSFPSILKDLRDSNREEYYRSDILDAYFNHTHDFDALRKLLTNIFTDGLRWSIVKLLITEDQQHEFLINYLKSILQEDYELQDNKLKAADYLMQLNQTDGLVYVADIIFNDKSVAFDFNYRLQTMPNIKTTDAIPILLKLLKISKQPEFEKDRFNSLSSVVFNTFYSIGMQSEKNFLQVKNALEKFIEENNSQLSHLNFIHFNIQRIEEQLYLNKSQSYTIKDALNEYKALSN